MKKEIGIQNRETKENFFTPNVDEEIYFSSSYDLVEDETIVYAFESNAELFRIKGERDDPGVNRAFLKKFKLIRPGAVKRFKNNI